MILFDPNFSVKQIITTYQEFHPVERDSELKTEIDDSEIINAPNLNPPIK